MSRASNLTVGALVACLAAGSACASRLRTISGWDPNVTAPTYDAVRAAAARVRAEQCHTPSCQAIEAIDGLLNIVKYMDDNADMSRRDRVLYSRSLIRRRLRRVLLGRPYLYAPFCATSVKLLSRVSPDPTEIVVPVTLLAQGVAVDIRDQGHCAGDMVSVLPRSPAIDQVRRNLASGCDFPDDGHPRPKAACETLLEGLPATR